MEYTKICLNCGEEFKTSSKLSLYCKEACRKAYSRRREPSSEKQLSDLSKEIEALPDFIESIEPLEEVPFKEELQEGWATINVKEAAAAGLVTKGKVIIDKEEPMINLSGFHTFQDGLKLFTDTIRNNKLSRETKHKHLSKLREAAKVHPDFSNNQMLAITDRIRNYFDGTYTEKFLPHHFEYLNKQDKKK